MEDTNLRNYKLHYNPDPKKAPINDEFITTEREEALDYYRRRYPEIEMESEIALFVHCEKIDHKIVI